MVSAAHTKGPWTYRHSRKDGDVGILADGGCLAEVFSEIRSASEGAFKEQEANARLIAAAPDLLRLCELVNDSFGGGRTITFTDSDIEDFAAVIAKAKGGTE